MKTSCTSVMSMSGGRTLGYTEYGCPDGYPIFLFHGQPGNRLFRHPDEGITKSLGVRIVVPDRPGYGLSSFQAGRRLMDWPQDVVALANHLGMGKFSVLGYSAGGAYAAACAQSIPERMDRVGLMSSAAPLKIMEQATIGTLAPSLRLNAMLFKNTPALAGVIFTLYWRYSRRHPEAFIRMGQKQFSEADQAVLQDPDILAILLEVWKENIRVDCKGYVHDAQILMSEWGFSLQRIRADVTIWHGLADSNIESSIAKAMAGQIPNCKTVFYPGEGHLAIFTHWGEILCYLRGER